MRLNGRGISPGLALGKAFVYEDILHQHLDHREIDEAGLENEVVRVEQSIEAAVADLERTVSEVTDRLDADHAGIFEFQVALLRDEDLVEELRREIVYGRRNAEHVVKRVFRRWEKRFQELEDPVLRQRCEDLRDVSRRVLEKLKGVVYHALENVPENSVIVAKRLLPSDTVVLSRRQTAAVAVERGGPASHAAIIAREMGIPAVAGLAGLLEQVKTGDDLLVDGFHGTVEIRPDEQVRAEFVKRVENFQRHIEVIDLRKREPAETTDGKRVQVMANIGSQEDAMMAAENGADGIGLLRTELLYLSARTLPSETELLKSFGDMIRPLKGKPVTVRLLDIGGDKELTYIDLGMNERNPFLGRRGVRLLLAQLSVLDEQLRALLRLFSEFPLAIMIPMVTLPDEVRRVRARMEAVAKDLSITKLPPLGAMVETPAAALSMGDIAAEAEFLSVGTNDLTQYTMAVSREDPQVSEYFRDDHPAVIRLLRIILDEAGKRPVSICGELAGRIEMVETLVQLGFRSLSVAPPLVGTIKEAVRHATARDVPAERATNAFFV